MIGIFGLVLVIAISIYQFATHGVGTTGVPPGQRLHFFAAPLANTNLIGDAEPRSAVHAGPPRSAGAQHLPDRSAQAAGAGVLRHRVGRVRARRSTRCRRSRAGSRPARCSSPRSPCTRSRSATAAADPLPPLDDPRRLRPRRRRSGALYGVAVCPMVELAYRGGIVSRSVDRRSVADQRRARAARPRAAAGAARAA